MSLQKKWLVILWRMAHSVRVSGRSRCRNVTIFRPCLWRIIEIYCSTSNIFASNRRLLQGETAITVGQKRGSCQSGSVWPGGTAQVNFSRKPAHTKMSEVQTLSKPRTPPTLDPESLQLRMTTYARRAVEHSPAFPQVRNT